MCTSVPSFGWVERERRERESRKGNGEHTAVEDQSDNLNEERMSHVIAEVQKAHPDVKLEPQDNSRSITVGALSKLSIQVLTRRTDAVRRKLYETLIQSQNRTWK